MLSRENEHKTIGVGYKIDVIEALKKAGYSSYRIRKEKIFGDGTMQRLRHGKEVTWSTIAVVCNLLGCKPEDVVCLKDTDNE